MNYTIKQLSDLAGVSTRTLRYYDQIDLLKPERINQSGYRVYGPKQVDLLQQILFYRELAFSLKEIRSLLKSPNFNLRDALTDHHQKLIAKKLHLEQLIRTVEQTLAAQKGAIQMTDHEKFDAFKKEKLAENERKYGREIRENYGEKTIEKANKQFAGLSRADYEKTQAIEKEMFENLSKAMQLNDPASAPAQKAAALHRQWLFFFWPEGTYSKEAHAGLAQMYVDDPRFTSYYDTHLANGAAKMLRDAVNIFTQQN